MVTVQNNVGRLIEVRLRGLVSPDELARLGVDLPDLVVPISRSMIYVVDARDCSLEISPSEPHDPPRTAEPERPRIRFEAAEPARTSDMLAKNPAEQSRAVLANLTSREEAVLRERFGVGIEGGTEVARFGPDFEVTRERIQQIEAKALRKLRHPSPSRSRSLDPDLGYPRGESRRGNGRPPRGARTAIPGAERLDELISETHHMESTLGTSMPPVLVHAAREQTKLRLVLSGPSGSGKTFTALTLGAALSRKLAVIDTEYGSSMLYADRFSFERCTPESFSPEAYVEAIHVCENAGCDLIIIDSLSHAWMGRGGTLEKVDQATAGGMPSHLAWREVTPAHNALIDAMMLSSAHVIATLRSKTEHGLDHDDRGRLFARRVGLAPVQRDGIEYDFDLSGEIDLDHRLTLSKGRATELSGRVFEKPGAELAAVLKAWLAVGTPRRSVASKELRQASPSSPRDAAKPSASQPVLARIEAARAPADLNSLLKAIQALPEAEQAVVRPIFDKRKNEVLTAARKAKAPAAARAGAR